MPATAYVISPVVINLAKCIYYAQAECFGTASDSFDSLTPRERARFIEIAAHTLIALTP